MSLYLIVGLGNPTDQYAHTRHNAGFDVVDLLARKINAKINRHRFRALVGEAKYEGHRLILALPQTYMNLSGESVSKLVSWYKPDVLLLVYDDADLPAGSVRVRASGSAGTHNGMRSVVESLGRADFPRVRVGIGAPPEGWELYNYVTSHYPPEAWKIAEKSFERAAEAVLAVVRDGVDAAMREFNAKVREITNAKEDA